MDAGGAIVHRATREPAGCGRRPRHPAARRAAKNKPYPHPDHPKEAGRTPASMACMNYAVRAAGRGVDAQIERGDRHICAQSGAFPASREPGMDARLQRAAGRGVDTRI